MTQLSAEKSANFSDVIFVEDHFAKITYLHARTVADIHVTCRSVMTNVVRNAQTFLNSTADFLDEAI